MDTSETYIKMCDCPEIQEGWKPKEGDFFTFCGDPKIIKDYETWALEKREPSDVEEWDAIIKTMGGQFVDHFLEAREHFVFTPRQDQIQEMIGYHKDSSLLLYNFFKFCFRDSIINLMEGCSNGVFRFPILTSREQLWLAFYMYEKHSMIWDGDKWIRRQQ